MEILRSICGCREGLPNLLWRSDCGVFVGVGRVYLTSCGDQTVEFCGSRAGLPCLLWRTDCGVFVGLVRFYLNSCGEQTVEYLWV